MTRPAWLSESDHVVREKATIIHIREVLSFLVHETDLFADEEIRIVVDTDLRRAGLEREGDLFSMPFDEIITTLHACESLAEDAEQKFLEALMGW